MNTIQENYTFCTIITGNYYPYAQALLHSVREFNCSIHLNILISDGSEAAFLKENKKEENVYFHFSESICKKGIEKQIFDKYHASYHDGYRWSMKPAFSNYLIREKSYEKVICVDCDIFFFNDYMFLFDALDVYNILLTPHWRSRDPFVDAHNFNFLFSHGMFNAGFFAINKDGVDAMDWWAKACLYSCSKTEFEGQYDDQAYLNLLPVYFDKVHILTHQGCNVAFWNTFECRRVLQIDGSVLINNRYPIVFIHFVSIAKNAWDIRLSRYLYQYLYILEKYSEKIYDKEYNNRLGNRSKKSFKKDFIVFVRMTLLKIIVTHKRFKASKALMVFSEMNSGSETLLYILSNLFNLGIIHDPLDKENGVLYAKDLKSLAEPSENETQVKLKVLTRKILKGKLLNHWTSGWSSLKSFWDSKKIIVKIYSDFNLLPSLVEQIHFEHKPIVVLRHPCAFALSLMYKTEYEINTQLDNALKSYPNNSLEFIEFVNSITTPFEKLVLFWCVIHAQLVKNQHTEKKWLLVFYENLKTDTAREIIRICDELNLGNPNISEKTFKMPTNLFVDDNSYLEMCNDEWLAILSDEDCVKVDHILLHFGIEIYTSHNSLLVI